MQWDRAKEKIVKRKKLFAYDFLNLLVAEVTPIKRTVTGILLQGDGILVKELRQYWQISKDHTSQ
jgi:hypothetical protein